MKWTKHHDLCDCHVYSLIYNWFIANKIGNHKHSGCKQIWWNLQNLQADSSQRLSSYQKLETTYLINFSLGSRKTRVHLYIFL